MKKNNNKYNEKQYLINDTKVQKVISKLSYLNRIDDFISTVNSIFKFQLLYIRFDFMNSIKYSTSANLFFFTDICLKRIFERKKITRFAITLTIYFSMKNSQNVS